jgi:hypothetical protein
MLSRIAVAVGMARGHLESSSNRSSRLTAAMEDREVITYLSDEVVMVLRAIRLQVAETRGSTVGSVGSRLRTLAGAVMLEERSRVKGRKLEGIYSCGQGRDPHHWEGGSGGENTMRKQYRRRVFVTILSFLHLEALIVCDLGSGSETRAKGL